MSTKELIIKHIEPPKDRIIAIGDIHGCIVEFRELVDKLQITENDLVVLLGDLVDRGSDSEAVIQYYLELKTKYNILAVQGNHDEKIVRYHSHILKQVVDPNYKIPMRRNETYYTLSPSSINALSQLPHCVFLHNKPDTNIAFVHSGISPQEFKQPLSSFIRNRYFTKNVHTNTITPVQSKNIDGVWYVPEGSYPWHYYWDGRYTVVYGHIVYSIPEIVNNTIGIDGGCCFGGCLRAWVKNNQELSFFLDVPAKHVYYTHK
jgi:diadenosine tetraphosphatase ApaH/serine/threonine PP2A family protein phosphatase